MNTSELQKIKQRYTIVGNSDGLNRALDVALQVAPTDLSVLIIGESGVGKEVIPRIIHDNSPRKKQQYFAINCGSIPEGTIDSELFGHEKGSYTGAISDSEGYFGTANGGTLFLDEVGELPLSTQARLLRVLETGEYIRVGGTAIRKTDVRIVAATNVNMQKAISEGKFREDLYYRLNTIPIQMPPLRDRGDDVVLLFRLFAMQIAEKLKMDKVTLTDEAKEMLKRYKWPGNIRQLKNVTEQISVISRERTITPEILSQFIPIDQESTQLVAVKSTKGEHSFENEREILYKILFELRSNVNDLRSEMDALRKQLVKPVEATAQEITQTSVPAIDTANMQTPAALMHTPATMDDGQSIFIRPLANAKRTMPEIAEAEEVAEAENLNLNDMGRTMLEKALEKNGGNRQKAAEELGISARTLYRRIKQYGLDK